MVAQAKVFEELEPMPKTRLLKSLSKTKLSFKEISNKLRLETRRRLSKRTNEDFSELEIRRIFDLFNIKHDESLSAEDIYMLLEGEQSLEDIRKTFDILDEDADGKLSFEEFYLIMNS
jgi:hypothetical protein